jgi:hypothetical protein
VQGSTALMNLTGFSLVPRQNGRNLPDKKRQMEKVKPKVQSLCFTSPTLAEGVNLVDLPQRRSPMCVPTGGALGEEDAFHLGIAVSPPRPGGLVTSWS